MLQEQHLEQIGFQVLGLSLSMVVYHLHGKPIRFEIVLMVSKILDRKPHSDYALSI
jgi:hypothetical protein